VLRKRVDNSSMTWSIILANVLNLSAGNERKCG
jgi:hypothetical protein